MLKIAHYLAKYECIVATLAVLGWAGLIVANRKRLTFRLLAGVTLVFLSFLFTPLFAKLYLSADWVARQARGVDEVKARMKAAEQSISGLIRTDKCSANALSKCEREANSGFVLSDKYKIVIPKDICTNADNVAIFLGDSASERPATFRGMYYIVVIGGEVEAHEKFPY